MMTLAKSRVGRPNLQVGLKPHPDYTLQEFLGSGGFGEVWRAVTRANEVRALKFMPCRDDRAALREMRAIRMVRDLKHPHLLRIETIWSYNEYLVVAMELADSGLDHLLRTYEHERNSPMSPLEVLTCLEQVADGLDFLNKRQHRVDGHLASIQHADVKPSNMLLCGKTVKLADFGLATPVVTATQPHRRAGTADYAAPEVFQGAISVTTDQFALAVSYVQLRTGAFPFPPAPVEIPLGYVRPKADLSLLPEKERPVVARALHLEPGARWPSCLQFILRLVETLF